MTALLPLCGARVSYDMTSAHHLVCFVRWVPKAQRTVGLGAMIEDSGTEHQKERDLGSPWCHVVNLIEDRQRVWNRASEGEGPGQSHGEFANQFSGNINPSFT